MSSTINILTEDILQFRKDRKWEQFHTLKNLMASLNLEASELLELTQWKTDEEMTEYMKSSSGKKRIAEECSDIFIYLLMICHDCNIDLLDAARKKLEINAQKYPVENSIGSSKKYTEF